MIWIFIISAVVLLDQITKHLVMNFLSREEPFVLINGVLRFTYVENDGAAFGGLGDHRWIFMIVSVVGIAAMLVYLFKYRPQSKIACTALSFVIGGGIGNMIDRTLYEGTLPSTEGKNVVIDFIDFYALGDLWKWVFNVADSFVCIGGGMLMIWCVVSLVKELRAERAAGGKHSCDGASCDTQSDADSDKSNNS